MVEDWAKPRTEEEWRELDKKVSCARLVRGKVASLKKLKKELSEDNKTLTNFCRQCKDRKRNCLDRLDCEIKMTLDAITSI